MPDNERTSVVGCCWLCIMSITKFALSSDVCSSYMSVLACNVEDDVPRLSKPWKEVETTSLIILACMGPRCFTGVDGGGKVGICEAGADVDRVELLNIPGRTCRITIGLGDGGLWLVCFIREFVLILRFDVVTIVFVVLCTGAFVLCESPPILLSRLAGLTGDGRRERYSGSQFVSIVLSALGL